MAGILASLAALTCWADIAVLDMTRRNNELEESGDYARQVYSAQYLCDIAGYNYFTTTDLDSALTGDVLLLSGCMKSSTFSSDELQKIEEWVKDGGILVAGAIRSVNSKYADTVSDLFGIDATQSPAKNSDRTLIRWNPAHYADRELEYIDEPEERETSIGQVKSFSFTPKGCDVLASFNTGEAAVARHTLGQGKSYLVAVPWRDVVQRNQLNKDQKSCRVYNNGFEPSSDVWALFLRSVCGSAGDVSVWKFTVPGGYDQILVPTHDCDSRTAYDAMHYMADYEKSMGCKGHYFLTTHYYSDKVNFGHTYLSDFYNDQTIPKAKALIEGGHTVGSHSVCHFPDFNKVDNVDVVSREEYARRATCIDGTSRGASTWAEIALSKQIIEGDLHNRVRSFRSGHLHVNKDFHSVMEGAAYQFQSCYTAGDLLSEFPFFGRLDNDWSGRESTVLTIPLHISDVYDEKDAEGPLNDDTWSTHLCVDRWAEAMRKLRGNHANAVLLIHPNRDWKMELQKKLMNRLTNENVRMYNFEDYGDFWLARHNCKFAYEYKASNKSLEIKASDAAALLLHSVPFVVETQFDVAEATIIDSSDGLRIATEVKRLAPGRLVIVPKADTGVEGVKEIPSASMDASEGYDGVVDLTGRQLPMAATDLPKGIYIVRNRNGLKKIIK